nr:TonB-dependent receptor [Cytophagales bacterium]
YVSESFLANDNDRSFVTPAFHLLNLRLALVVAGQRLTLAANNLTDELYFTGGQVTNAEPYYFAQAGRNYFATLHLRF